MDQFLKNMRCEDRDRIDPLRGVRLIGSSAFGPDGPVTLWKTVKTNFDANGEIGGRRLDLVCRLDEEPNGDGPAWGTCREAILSSLGKGTLIAEDEELQLTWQWPAGRAIAFRLLVHVERVEAALSKGHGVRTGRVSAFSVTAKTASKLLPARNLFSFHIGLPRTFLPTGFLAVPRDCPKSPVGG